MSRRDEKPEIVPFADALILRQRQLGHPLCVGLDPHLSRIPPLFRRGTMLPADPRTASVVGHFLRAVIDRVAPRVAVVKPQIAFFEQLGWRGIEALGAVIAHARRAGLLVVLDAKRGDIGSTAAAYATAYFGPAAALPVHAITVNPYLGGDSLTPLFDRARETGCGLFVLVKTSNPGSGDFQDRQIDGRPFYEVVARSLDTAAESLIGLATGWSSLGVVVGATYPEENENVRACLPRSLFLVPGYGAQGGSAAQAVRGFLRGPDGRLEGGLVNSSRGILFPEAGDTGDDRCWEQALDSVLDKAISELGEAVA